MIDKFNILKQLKEKIVKELYLSNEKELSLGETDILNICTDIINSILDDKNVLEKENYNLTIEIKNLKINFEELLKENKLLKNELNANKRDKY